MKKELQQQIKLLKEYGVKNYKIENFCLTQKFSNLTSQIPKILTDFRDLFGDNILETTGRFIYGTLTYKRPNFLRKFGRLIFMVVRVY